MFFAAAVIAASLASVGTTIGVSVAQQKQADKGMDKQREFTLINACVDYGQALARAPGAVPTS
ncbi:hypothetical protein SAMN05216359_102498 [Roseateles sp. YR242]|uniref:hypothetical protein n=1 Tax=Roseateles sp. YR242 TaxID=1855305 RepID=UPI0008C909B7|nr:hypothetical protein [Roseateles sp. YR242]SEK63855.1 hypothetical protein SAMN05216359_102498 [Roseateles sp. YR242]